MKVDEGINKYKKDLKLINSNEDYETDLRKEEAAIRKHISIQHQMKLYIDKIEEKLENYEKNNQILIKKINNINENKKNIDNNYNEKIKKLENDKNKLNLNILELKNTIVEKEKKIKILENKLNLSTTNYLSSFYSKDSKNNNSNNTIYFYNQSNNTSMNNNNNKSRSYSKNTKKPSKQIYVTEKFDFYQKLIDTKLHDITRNKNTHLTFRERSISSIESDMSSIHKMNDDLTQRLNNISVKILGNEREKRSFTPNKINTINSNNNYKKINKNINLINNTNNNNLRNNHNLNKKNYLSEFTNILYNNINNNSLYHNNGNNKNIKKHKRYNSVENNIQMNNDRLSFNYSNNINNNNYNNINNISNMNKYKKQKLSKEVNLRQYLYIKYNSSNINNNNKNNNYLINSYKKI